MSIPAYNEIIEENDQTEARLASLNALRELVGNTYPNKFVRSNVSGGEDTITAVKAFGPVAEIVDEIAAVVATLAERERPPAEIKDALNERLRAFGTVRIAGRLTTPPRGNFVHLTDGISKLQVYCDKKGGAALIRNDGKDTLDPENGWNAWKLLDHGDFIGVEGYLFITNTGELSVHIEKLQFLAKAMLPMPDKMHGIADAEIRQRQRYYDLIGSSLQVEHEGLTTREVFEVRAKTISSLRRFLEDNGYVEVETPMLTPKATGAAAKPFKTHHNALDIDLYARIAPELYLKRLVVGGFEKVYELNRNFRNEGISYKHNPEFTMLEFYCAYMDVNGMMDFCEELMRQSVLKATGGFVVNYEGNQVDFSKFERVTMKDAVARYAPQVVVDDTNIVAAFDEHVEHNLIQPTFIIDYPKSISPLSKASPENPEIAERFELFINGMEVANGFSELNDPKEQYERFVDQMSERERGDEEAMVLDEDYIRALSYGMPPAAGIGIGIDRLVMLLTNKHSIRDVILFPHMRPEKKDGEKDGGDAGEAS
jgi:lysyl-tRNA synthetase class 2